MQSRVLIVDDASSDDSWMVAQSLASLDERVQAVRHERNAGHIATYNEGLLGWADADFTVLLSADDMLSSGALRRATRIMQADPRVGMVYGRPLYFSAPEQVKTAAGRERSPRYWPGRSWIEGRFRAGHNVISSPEVVIRTSVQHRVGGYDPALPHAADFDMWLRIAAVADVAYVRGVPQAFYRKHSASMTIERDWLRDITERRAVFDKFAAAHGSNSPEVRTLHRAAQRALAAEAVWRACRSYDRDEVELRRTDDVLHFARNTYSDLEALPEFRALRRRRRLGPRVCRGTQLFACTAAYRRVKNWLWWKHWEREGT